MCLITTSALGWTVLFFADTTIASQRQVLQKFRYLLANSHDPLSRANRPGHITGSAYVTDEQMQRVLLTLHGKLNLWLQLGGHADKGQRDVAEVALREAKEESGLRELFFFKMQHLFRAVDLSDARIPFYLDIHPIGAIGDDTAHLHYDISFLLIAQKTAPLLISEESHDLRWFSWEEAYRLDEPSLLQALMKIIQVKKTLKAKTANKVETWTTMRY